MPARTLRRFSLLIAVSGVLSAGLGATTASAEIPWGACPTAGFQCGGLTVPLDRSGGVPGAIDLSLQRVPAATNPNRVAVVPLAGGPGQAALPLAQTFAKVLGPALADRDLLLFDQRGTGASGALSCKALGRRGSIVKLAESCAEEIGPARGFYRTVDTVADLETLRIAAGYAKLVLFGVSYGTKVAEDYAATYPNNVEALVLDSVVLPEGPDPFQRSTLRDAPRVLRDLCAAKACKGATDSVQSDLSRLAAKLRKGSLRGKVVLPSGRRTTLSMGQGDLLSILLAGDLNPTLRAELPGSMRAALRGDGAPLLRLAVRSEGLAVGLSGRQDVGSGGDSDALFLATTCEEAPFAWTRTAGAEQRYQEITAAARAIPKDQLGPFSPAAAVQSGPIGLCLGWPDASPAPAPPPPLPAVRTLVLDGQMDLRTPMSDAAQIAQRIPGTTVVQVPFTGHSTISSDASSDSACTKGAIATFFAGGVPAPCAAGTNPFSPTRLPPTSLEKITAASRSRRTVIAAAATVTDAARQIIGDALALEQIPKRVGGLRAGNATVNRNGSFRLNRYQYVPGVIVSGKVDAERTARITIRGGGALSGNLTITAGGAVNGRLGGRKVTIGAAASARSALPTVEQALERLPLMARR
jgi:pimeloyl-ACP methyl ester carboxylesterase